MKRALLLTAALLVVLSSSDAGAFAPERAQKAPERVRAWREDLDVLAKTLKEKHWNAFFKVKQERFEKAVADLRKRIPALKDREILVGFIRIAAMIGDSHTLIRRGGSRKFAFRRYPLSFVWCSDGLFVASASKEHRSLLRAKLTGIGKFKLEDVFKKLAVLDAAENESWRQLRVLNRLNQTEVLAVLGIVDNMERAGFAFVDAKGKPRRVVLKPTPIGNTARLVSAFNASAKGVLPSRRSPRDWYGFEWMPKTKTLYCWYDRCRDQPKRKVAAWCKDVLAEIDARPVERVVVDLRRNGGGASRLARPLIDGLQARKKVNRKGMLFVLIGRGTFSSAMLNTWELQRRTNAVLIGLPTGGSPNAPGEARTQKLPNSGLLVQYSTKWFGLTGRTTIRLGKFRFSFSGRKMKDPPMTIPPDLKVEPSSTNYFKGRDVALEAALTYKPKRSKVPAGQ